METLSDFTENPISEKVALVFLEPKERILSGWSLFSGSVYVLDVKYFTVNVRVAGIKLDQASSTSLSSGQFFYDSNENKVYVRLSDDSNPKQNFTSLDYRFFYSNAPLILPYDLSTGRDVYFDARLTATDGLSSNLDPDDLVGISLTGSGSIVLNNKDAGFSPIYDKLFWEGAKCEAYIWNPEIDVTEAQIIFKGRVENKSYSDSTFTLRVKDFVNETRNELPLDVFEDTDGRIPESIIGKPKRRIYGQVDGLKCVSLNQQLDSYEVAGNFSQHPTIISRLNYSGSGLTDLIYKDDIIIYKDENNEDVELRADIVESNYVIVTEDITTGIDSGEVTIRPAIPYRKINREWMISSHALKEVSTTIVSIRDQNRVIVADTKNFAALDVVFIGSERKVIRRISSDMIVFDTNFQTTPIVGATVKKLAVQKVYIENQLLVVNRDYSIINTVGKSAILLDDEAEVNIARPEKVEGNYSFINGSNEVTVSGVDATTRFKVKDWIRPNLQPTFYEVRSVEETKVILNANYSDPNQSGNAERKRPDYVSDETNLTVTCLGKTDDGTAAGEWIRSGAKVVQDIIEEQGLDESLDTSKFDRADEDAPYLMSIALPLIPFEKKPKVREVIDLVNRSIFGSLHNDKDFNIVYNVLTPRKPNIQKTLRDDDIVGYTIKSSGKNVTRKITSNYNHKDYNFILQEKSNETIIVVNEYVDNISDIVREETIQLYLYNKAEATIITQRISLLREFANLIVEVKTKMNLIDKSINDVLYFELDKLFERYGTLNDNNRIGAITGIKKGIYEAMVTVTDLSSLYNKVCTIAENEAKIYTESSIIERAKNGYFTDNFGLVNDNQHTSRMNLIG